MFTANRKETADSATLAEIEALSDLLKGSGITTLADLKRCIATNADYGIGWVAHCANASESLLMALLIADMRDNPARSDNQQLTYYWRALNRLGERPKLTKLKRSWLAVVVFGALAVILIVLGLRAYSINRTVAPHVSVKPHAHLSIYQKVSDEVELTTKPGSDGALTSLDNARDRYTLGPIAAGAALKEDALLSADLSSKMKGRKILSLPLRVAGQGPDFPMPREAMLVLSPKKLDAQEKDAIYFAVILLRVDKQADLSIATVAFPADQFDRAARLLASHEVFLAQPIQ